MKYTVYISGYGAEITVGTPNQEELELLCESEKDLAEIVTEDFEERSWYDIDDQYHRWGAAGKFTITIQDESGNTVVEFDSENLNYSEETDEELIEPNFIEIDETNPLLFCVSFEKGQFFEGEFETEEFDIHKFKVQIDTEIGIDEYYFGDIVTSVSYDDEEVENFGGSTDGKSFEVYKNFDQTTIRDGKINKLL